MSDAIREAFEDHVRSSRFATGGRIGDNYANPLTQRDWELWQAAFNALQSQTAPAVPVGLRDRLLNLLCALGHQGCDMGDGLMYDVGEWGIKEAQELHTLLAAAPQPDHSPGAGKVVAANPCRTHGKFPCPECSLAHFDGCDCHYCAPTPAADGGEVESVGWSGWACHKMGNMPRVYGDKGIAELNCDTANGESLVFLSAHPAQPRNEVQAEALEAVWDKLYDMAEERSTSDPEESSGISTAVTLIRAEIDRLRSNGGDA